MHLFEVLNCVNLNTGNCNLKKIVIEYNNNLLAYHMSLKNRIILL